MIESHEKLLQLIKSRLAHLEELWEKHVLDDLAEEDAVYRYYHHSLKIYWIQEHTNSIVAFFEELARQLGKELGRDTNLNEKFISIVRSGTGHEFEFSHNSAWDMHTLPQLQAFWHTKYMLEMMIKYGKTLESAPQVLPFGWASVLYLYNLR
jgi:hypothetical protein